MTDYFAVQEVFVSTA